MRERNYILDLFKYLAALCIIAIHTEPLSDYNEVLNVFTVQILARLAVPFFAVCSGYLASARVWDHGQIAPSAGAVFRKQWSKLFRVYAVWSILYLLFSIPKWVQSGWFSAWAFVDYGVAAVRTGSHYHLWYLLSLLYAWPVFYCVLRYVKRQYWLPISSILYLVKVSSYAYRVFLPERIAAFLSLFDKYDGPFSGLFLLLPLMLLGAYFFEASRIKRPYSDILFGLSFFGLIFEAAWLFRSGQNKVSFIIFTYPTALFLFNMILNLNNANNKKLYGVLGAASLFVYCFHPMLVETLESLSVPHAPRFVVTAAVSTALGVLVKRFLTENRKRE